MAKIDTILLGSKSPRRRELLEGIGYNIQLATDFEVEEVFSNDLSAQNVAAYLSELKSSGYSNRIQPNEVLLTADTIVVLEGEVLGKPTSCDDAIRMLRALSGRSHSVITAVTLRTESSLKTISVQTDVTFRRLLDSEINYYVENFSPMDKAGAYGAQEWIGTIGIVEFKGSFHNVVGLPVAQTIELLRSLCEQD